MTKYVCETTVFYTNYSYHCEAGRICWLIYWKNDNQREPDNFVNRKKFYTDSKLIFREIPNVQSYARLTYGWTNVETTITNQSQARKLKINRFRPTRIEACDGRFCEVTIRLWCTYYISELNRNTGYT